MVPEPTTQSASGLTVQANGLPAGVKIIPLKDAPVVGADAPVPPAPANAATTKPAAAAPVAVATPASAPSSAGTPLIQSRSRIETTTAAAAGTTTKTRKRKPGRPKAGRLDTPIRTAPTETAATAPTPAPAPALRRMSDLSPRPAEPASTAPPPAKSTAPASAGARPKPSRPPKPHVHKVGVPPLHFGAVVGLSLRSRLRPQMLGLATLAAIAFGVVASYGAWLVATSGLPRLADSLIAAGPRLAIEAGIIALMYYIGRSIGGAAITFGIARESDARPASLGQQLAVGVNTFARRLALDAGLGLPQIILLGAVIALVWYGGTTWGLGLMVQAAILFVAFFLLLYLDTALALARGLAGVAITLTFQSPVTAGRLGFKLFSHRLELLGLKFTAAALELVLAIPLAVLAVALIIASPASLHLPAAIGVGLLALIAGALFGAGTASWWAALYRRIVTVDHPTDAQALLSARQPGPVSAGALTFIVAASSCLVTAALAVPWLHLG